MEGRSGSDEEERDRATEQTQRPRRFMEDMRMPVADARLSVWTVVGSIAASVVATALIGGASGLLQVPTIARDVDALKTTRDTAQAAYIQLAERVRSTELVVEAANRRMDDLVGQIRATDARRERAYEEFSKFSQMYVNEHAALEGRSKDRHTEAMGSINALRVADQSMRDRIESMAGAIQQMRGQMLEIASRLYPRPQNYQRQDAPQQQFTPWNHEDGGSATREALREQTTRWEELYANTTTDRYGRALDTAEVQVQAERSARLRRSWEEVGHRTESITTTAE